MSLVLPLCTDIYQVLFQTEKQVDEQVQKFTNWMLSKNVLIFLDFNL